jgi:hypothetical protein
VPRNKLGRPKKPKGEVREQRIVIRVSIEELAQLNRGAPTNLTTWIRNLALAAARRREKLKK